MEPKRSQTARGSRWAQLLTERSNPRSRRLDTLTAERIVALVLDEDRRGLVAAARQTRAIARAAQLVADALRTGNRVVLLGAGTSGRLGVLEAAECPPTFGTDPERIQGVMAGGRGAVFGAVEGAEDDEQEGRRQGAQLSSGDVLVGISASSVTPFVRGALAAARQRGARRALVTCVPSPGLGRHADVVVAVAAGPEVLTGSTRLKAGSATKAVLNAITTTAMVQLGKVYGNLMVDLRQGSAKLQDRARRIVMAAAAVDAAEADKRLAEASGEVKVAIVTARHGLSPAEARQRLAAAAGHVRQALAGTSGPPGEHRGKPRGTKRASTRR